MLLGQGDAEQVGLGELGPRVAVEPVVADRSTVLQVLRGVHAVAEDLVR